MNEEIKNLQYEKSNQNFSFNAFCVNKMFYISLATIIFLVGAVIANKHFIERMNINKTLWIFTQKDIKNRIQEKKQLRQKINSALIEIRLLKKHIALLCAQSTDKNNIDINITNKYQRAILELVNIFYQAKLVFGIDVSNVIVDFVKIADNNKICDDGSNETELRKFQHQANVLMEEAIIKEGILLTELNENGP